jgi:hypothetical protein
MYECDLNPILELEQSYRREMKIVHYQLWVVEDV